MIVDPAHPIQDKPVHPRSPFPSGLRTTLWMRGLKSQCRVVMALVIRDALGRYGHDNLGFFWIVGEPLIFTSSVIVLWSMAHLSHGEGVDVVPFALTGYSFITMWRHITSRSVGLLRTQAHLAYHRRINLIDSMIAMATLEIVSCFSAFIVAYVPLTLLGLCPVWNDPLPLIAAYCLTGAFALGFGLLLCGLSQMSEVLHHLVPAVMYISLPLTGIFFMVEWLPETARRIMVWSPLVNGMEMFRSGLFPPDVVTHWSAQYLSVCAACTLVVGYCVFHFAQRRMEA